MKIATIFTLIVAALFLGACDRVPSSNGGVTVVSTPGSQPGKNGMLVVVEGKSGRERHLVYDEDGALRYKGADNIWDPPGPRQHTAEPASHSARSSHGSQRQQYDRCKPCANGYARSPRPGSPCWCEWSGAGGAQASAGSRCQPCRQGYSHNPRPGKPCWCSPI